jgi:hypothetical protein
MLKAISCQPKIPLVRKNVVVTENIDQMIINQFNDWETQRKKTFLRFYKRDCLNTNIFLPSIDLTLNNLESLYDAGILDSIYKTNQSITQSFRSQAGRNFENLIYESFDQLKISYSKQVAINNDGIVTKKNNSIHILDLVHPAIKIGESISSPQFKLISIKTSLRERSLQDKYLFTYGKLIDLITLEDRSNHKDTNFNVISLCPKQENLRRFLNTLVQKGNQM